MTPTEAQPSYHLVEMLDSDGANDVWRGVQVETGRQVALKLFPTYRIEDTSIASTITSAFEALRGVSLKGAPDLISAHDTGDGFFCVAADYVKDRPLAQTLSLGHAMTPRQAMWTIATAACPLSTAMDLGVVQPRLELRDLRVDASGRITVVGLGTRLSYAERGQLNYGETYPRPQGLVHMSPECAEGDAFTACSAVYSLGSLLYRLAVGQPPYQSSSTFGLVTRILNEDPPRPSTINPTLPAPLERLIVRAMRRRPTARPGSISALLGALIDLIARHDADLEGEAGQALRDLGRHVDEDDMLAIVIMLHARPHLLDQRSVRDDLDHLGERLLDTLGRGQMLQDPAWRLLPFLPRVLAEVEKLAMDTEGDVDARREALRACTKLQGLPSTQRQSS